MSTPAWVTRIRRAVLAKPACYPTPRCPACGRLAAAADLDQRTGLCVACDLERDLEWRSRQASTMWEDGSPKVERPVDDALDSDKPFLVGD